MQSKHIQLSRPSPIRICEDADDPHVALHKELMQVIEERAAEYDLNYQGISGALRECQFEMDEERRNDDAE